MQAVHDMLYHGTDLEKYDFREFPGAVPRTFIGALATSLASKPLVALLSSLFDWPKLRSLCLARAVLGLACAGSLARVQQAVGRAFGARAGACFGLLVATQFHLSFYASRFLPNTYALIASNLALANLLLLGDPGEKEKRAGRLSRIVLYLTFGAAIFRCDLALLIIPVALALLVLWRASLKRMILSGAAFSALAVGLTVLVDSVFWGRPIWPELAVFLFNNPVDNRSAQWGVHAAHWYFTSAMPRALTGSLLFAAVGALFERRARPYVAIAVAFVGLFSIMPHKELRFIFPALPFFNVTAAAGLDRLLKMKRGAHRVAASAAAMAVLAASVAYTCVAARASALNYPGGAAFEQLHVMGLREQSQPVKVHICDFAAKSGVTRFGEEYGAWTYSKEDHMVLGELRGKGFDYLVSEEPEVRGYRMVKPVAGFGGLRIPKTVGELKSAVMASGLPLSFETPNQVYIHRALDKE